MAITKNKGVTGSKKTNAKYQGNHHIYSNQQITNALNAINKLSASTMSAAAFEPYQAEGTKKPNGYVKYKDELRKPVVAWDDDFFDDESLVFGTLAGEWKDGEGKVWYIVRMTDDVDRPLPELYTMLTYKNVKEKHGELFIGAFTHFKYIDP